jgi:hypothetical protein
MGKQDTNEAKPRKGTNHRIESSDHPSPHQLDQIVSSLNWVITPKVFSDMPRHGNSTWNPVHFVGLVVLSAWCEGKQLTAAFTKAKEAARECFGSVAVSTYQGMMRALVNNQSELLTRMWSRLQTLMAQTAQEFFRIGCWCPLAVDGSRFSTPRSIRNEQAFSVKSYGKGRDAKSRRHWKNKQKRSKKLGTLKPQIWLTLVWHMGLKLPWCWKSGASNSSERQHLIELLASMVFPEKTLFCGDAGFVGYKLWRGIMESSHSFLIRVGANVHLLKNLGQVRTNGNCVWVWPRDVMKRDMPPIQLRLITVQIGSKTMYLVTNVLSERNLSVKMIKQLYTLRWGIELHFRSTKQTFERGTLRSRNSDNSLAELDWSLIALTMIQLMAIREQTKIDVPPEHTSVAQALKAVRFAIYTRHVPLPKEQLLNRQLRLAVIDDYERLHSKRGRYHPNKKRKPSATKPILTQASKTQKSAYQQYKRAA